MGKGKKIDHLVLEIRLKSLAPTMANPGAAMVLTYSVPTTKTLLTMSSLWNTCANKATDVQDKHVNLKHSWSCFLQLVISRGCARLASLASLVQYAACPCTPNM